MPSLNIKPFEHPGLILDKDDLKAIRRKVEEHAWAKAAYDRLIEGVDAIEDIHIDDRKGQWMHFYVCEDDGTSLETVSPTEHRCPSCERVYTGEPYDSVVIRNQHMRNIENAVDLGLAWQLSGETRYRELAGQFVLGYADRYLSYEWIDQQGKKDAGGRVFCTTLNEANWLISMAWAYDLIATNLTESERRHVCEDCLIPAAKIVITPRRPIHNITCWRNSAIGLAALCARDEVLYNEAVNSESGLHEQIKQGILGDGMWWECSWGYHFYTIQAIWPLVEAVRKQGIDVYDDHYKGLFEAPIGFAFPGGILPPINDSGSGVKLPARCEPYEIAYARYQDPSFFRILESLDRTGRLSLCFGIAESVPPPEGNVRPPGRMRGRSEAGIGESSESANFPDTGIAILRDRESDTIVTLDYGPHGGGHGHPDKLGIILFSAGRIMAPDPGSIQYAAPLHRGWFKTTVSHNTVAVDGQPQEPCTGKLLRFDVDEEVQIVAASADDAYPGVCFTRTVALTPGGVILDVCDLSSNSEHTYDWIYHNCGDFTTGLETRVLDGLIAEDHGYQNIRSAGITDTGDAWWANWMEGDEGIFLRMLGGESTEVFTGIGYGNPPPRTLPMVIARRHTDRTRYVSVLVPRAAGAGMPQISIEIDGELVRLSSGSNTYEVQLT